MKIIQGIVGFVVVLCGIASAEDVYRGSARYESGPATGLVKAAVDTMLLMGAHGEGAPYIGTFETTYGAPDWNGWTSVDLTQKADSYWHVDTFNVVNGTYSAWCGSMNVLSCGPGDPDGGYGRNYNERLEWRGTVADPALPCTVSVAANINIDTQHGYDYFYISYGMRDQLPLELFAQDGLYVNLPVSVSAVYDPAEYLGDNANEVVVYFRASSDGGWDGEDCAHPNQGLVQLDDVVIALSNGAGYSHDFEDGTMGDIKLSFARGVGNFAKLWKNLPDWDPCVTNSTPQVAFIDDGLVVPGTGGSYCVDYCYGPGEFVVNSTGGVAENQTIYNENHHLDNAVESPPMAWGNPDHDSAVLSFSAYRHENLLDSTAAGIFYYWRVRSVATGNPADLAEAEWQDHNTLSLTGPNYHREIHIVGDLLVPGRTHVQVQLKAWEFGWQYGWYGNNATPAPYLDNVRLQTFPAGGPSLSATAGDLANDGFPGNGLVDQLNLGNNSVPFDASSYHELAEAAFDSVRVTCKALGDGAVLSGPPQLHYRLHRNSAFDAYRTSGLADMGVVDYRPTGSDAARWAVDLPDENFFFPGDRLHYFITATQDVSGQPKTSILPADTTGFDRFSDYPVINGGYDSAFAVRGLPSIREVVAAPGSFDSPRVLLWHDSGTDADWDLWTNALNTIGSMSQVDIFHTQSASSRLFNGLGYRATVDQLALYDVIIYTGGEMLSGTIDENLDYWSSDRSDAQALDGWLRLGGKNLLAFGNDLASDLSDGTAIQNTLVNTWFDVTVGARDVAPAIADQGSPFATPEVGNPVFTTVNSWLAYGGGCSSAPYTIDYVTNTADRFDDVTANAAAVRLAGWTAPDGSPGGYPQAAAVLRVHDDFDARLILIPTDFGLLLTDPAEGAKTAAPLPARVRLLSDALAYFGHTGDQPGVSSVPEAGIFTAAVHPNPFNPVTTISYTVDGPGRLTVKIFDLRGLLVRELYEGQVSVDGTLVWDGRRGDGNMASSGIYFYEARLRGEVRGGKMALVK